MFYSRTRTAVSSVEVTGLCGRSYDCYDEAKSWLIVVSHGTQTLVSWIDILDLVHQPPSLGGHCGFKYTRGRFGSKMLEQIHKHTQTGYYPEDLKCN